jgi:glycosyltransferase involved in cell wall biosynthesis
MPASDPMPALAPASRPVVIIPAHDEAARIGPVVAAALTHLPVLVVDDGSRDDTAGVAAAAGATVLSQRPNQGKGAALRAGFGWALEHGHDAVLTLDADGQHDPAEIAAFLASDARTPADLPPIRRASNSIGGWAFSWAVGRPIADNQSGYRLIGRRLLPLLLDSTERGFEFEVEMITTCIRAGLSIGWVPIRTIYGDEASHIRPWAHFTNFVRVVRRARRDVRGRHPGR